MTTPYTTDELNELTETLRSALVSDILDGMGFRDQCLAPGLTASNDEHVVVGYAYNTATRIIDAMPDEPYTGLLAALDGVSVDDVWMISSDSDGALWGELTSTSVKARGVRGTVCDGYLRDSKMVRELGYPVYSRGTSPRDCAGRVEISPADGPIVVGGVTVTTGDLVVADDDGVVVVPAALIVAVVDAALEKAAAESEFRVAVAAGMMPSEAFERFGVL